MKSLQIHKILYIIIPGMIKTCGALTKKTLDAAKKSDPSDSLKIDALPALFKK